MSGGADIITRDLGVVWHPCTQMKDHETLPMLAMRRGEGVWLEDVEGHRYLDAVSSWWVNLHGHCNSDISAAIKRQVDQLEHVMLAGMTHEPAVQLAERLVEIAPAGLSRVFYVDNGSSAVEAALKMSFHYWRNRGYPDKRHFLTLSNSYHGETLGALAASDVALYREIYAPLLMPVATVPSPDCFEREPGEECAAHVERCARSLEQVLEQRGTEICALILEPLVQCAGGMRMYPPGYLRAARALCDRFKVHLIADEIAVGFGRTGTMFACEQADVSPDMLCLSKGITGGYLPLSVVLTGEEVYDAFYADYREGKAFLHSHSYTGNPLACAAALASLHLFERDRILLRNHETAARMAQAAAPLAAHPRVADVRQTGMIVAIEISRDGSRHNPYPSHERRGLRGYRHALTRGVLLRPLGNVLYWMPPYVINAEEVRLLGEVTAEAVDAATAG